jgi:hypothetical protein
LAGKELCDLARTFDKQAHRGTKRAVAHIVGTTLLEHCHRLCGQHACQIRADFFFAASAAQLSDRCPRQWHPGCSCGFLPFTSLWVVENMVMNFRLSFGAVAVLAVTSCASNPAEQVPIGSITSPATSAIIESPPPPTVVDVENSSPSPKVTRAPGPKTLSKCKGLPQLACINVEGCEWVRPASSTDRDGRLLTDYCGLKAATTSANQ